MTGGWPSPACGECPWPSACCSAPRKISARSSERTKTAAVRVSDGIQEALENVREIRATNQEARYLAGLNQKIDDHERVTIQGELGTGIFVNAASVIMRLGVATTILVGADRILSGQIDFMLLFLFLLVITRVLCALRPEPGPHRGDVRLPGVRRPHDGNL
ncbi:MAG: ABC transporter transmembrane domain-containing protein [Evtepia gabavorous]